VSLSFFNVYKLHDWTNWCKLAQELHVTRRSIARDIENLKNAGKLKRVGSDKGGFWEIVQ
jgi:predicted HTH transcriptional regulator